MAMLGCRLLNIDDPKNKDRKRLVTFVEIDAAPPTAIAVRHRLPPRQALPSKVRDWGKMAATFLDSPPTAPSASPRWETSQRKSGTALHPEIETMNSSRCSPTANSPMKTSSPKRGSTSHAPRELPGYKSPALSPATLAAKASTTTAEIVRDSQTLCQACAFPEPLLPAPHRGADCRK